MPSLKEADFERALQELSAYHLITIDDGFGQLTERGIERLGENTLDLSGLNNLRYGRMRDNSWQLILFAVQVTSYLSFGEKEYLPIESRPYYLQQIKKWLGQSKPHFIEKFQQELISIFEQLPQEEGDFLANQFSGYKFQGKTAFQLLPEKWQKTPWDLLYRQRALDLFFAHVNGEELKRLLFTLDQQNNNQSMLKTKSYFLAGKTVNDILALRHLKQGTINDHFIEWALLEEDFPFERFRRINFEGMNENQVIDARYQEYDVPYLNFRLSQISYLREHHWN